MEKQKILVVDDDKHIAELISLYMMKEGYETQEIYDGKEAAAAVEDFQPDLILLDLMLPGMDGYQVCTEVRKTSRVPIIMLTAKGETFDKVLGLELGADDYIVKPFEPLELLARIEIVLRRFNREQKNLSFRDITVNMEERSVRRGSEIIDLTPKEYDLLVLFLKHQNVALSRDKILMDVWECSANIETRTVDNHVQRLRKKLGLEDCLKTVFKVGYRLENDL